MGNETILDVKQGEASSTSIEDPDTRKNSFGERLNKAKASAVASLLGEFGVSSVDEIKARFEKLNSISKENSKLSEQLTQLKLEKTNFEKRIALNKALDEEKVFDSESLLQYVDLDSITIDAKGHASGVAEAIESLKTIKPHFFLHNALKGDSHQKSIDRSLSTTASGSTRDHLHLWLKNNSAT